MKKKLLRLRSLKLSKRKEFIAATIFLSSGFILLELVDPGIHFYVLGVLSICSLGVGALVLRENLRGIKWFSLLLLPVMFTISLGLFYFLLPVRWLTRIPILSVYAVGMYAIFLVENIYSVASSRSIQLFRVAQAVGFLATLATIFFFINTIFSFRLTAVHNMLVVAIIMIPLIMQSLWAVELSEWVSHEIVVLSVCFALIVAEVTLMISFWPLTPILASLFLTTVSYMLIGIGQLSLSRRLFRANVIDYIRVLIIVSILIVLTTRYR